MRRIGLILIGLTACIAILSHSAFAQQVTTPVAQGSDFWTGSMDPSLFQLHENAGDRACTATEKFVAVRGTLGFCIDADENAAGSKEFEDARETCASGGKRLPEPAEYKFACQASISGLNNMTNNGEWSSNFWFAYRGPTSPSYNYIEAPTAGDGSCNNMNFAHIGNNNNGSSTAPFRCVH